MFEAIAINTLIYGLLLLAYVSAVFLVAIAKKDNSVMDIAYGPAYFLSSLGMLLYVDLPNYIPWLILLMIGLWSLRLSVRIFRKNWGKPEDARYAAWREEWLKRGPGYFLLRSYLQINLLQGLVILLVSLPIIIATSANYTVSWPWIVAGLVVYLTGLAIESVADWQLDKFIAGKKAGTEKATLMTRGLFYYSRRPNYFGETLIWWGQAIMVISLPFGWLALVSPVAITYVVTRITGPMLEDMFLQKYPKEYQEYMRTTSYFVPWFKKS
jgi:steroid 5-alpha reductase family enzyme